MDSEVSVLNKYRLQQLNTLTTNTDFTSQNPS